MREEKFALKINTQSGSGAKSTGPLTPETVLPVVKDGFSAGLNLTDNRFHLSAFLFLVYVMLHTTTANHGSYSKI